MADEEKKIISVFNSDNIALHEMAKGILTVNNIKFFSAGEHLNNVNYIGDYLSLSVFSGDETKARSLLKDIVSERQEIKTSPVIRYGIVAVAILFVIIMCYIFLNYNK